MPSRQYMWKQKQLKEMKAVNVRQVTVLVHDDDREEFKQVAKRSLKERGIVQSG